LLLLIFTTLAPADDDTGVAVPLFDVAAPQLAQLILPKPNHGVQLGGTASIGLADPAAADKLAGVAYGLFDFCQFHARCLAERRQIAVNGRRRLAVRFQIIGVRLYFLLVDVREPANAQAFEIVRRLMEPV